MRERSKKYSTNNKVNAYAATNVGGQISSGTTLHAGDYIQSPDGRYTLVMQSDGNLVTYSADTAAIWNSGTAGYPGSYATLQNDGNLVVYDKNGNALWNTYTYTQGPSVLKMQSDGNLVVYRNSDNAYTWASWTQFNNYQVNNYIGTQIASGTTLYAGDYIRSPDYRYTLVMQEDGNLVVYSANRYTALWSSQTWNNPGAYATLQSDGNLVVYDKNGKALWNTYTYTQGPSVLKMQSDGNLVVYRNSDGWFTWYSGTAGSF
ncbi:MAG: curculin (mannose-binding) lectin [Candidatus Saccharibacteria bacterium]